MESTGQKQKRPAFKNDQYRRARGGSASFLTLYCSDCGSRLMLYQKDGPGRLLRCYFNRIFDPPELESLQFRFEPSRESVVPNLHCPKCARLVGVPMTHRDGRLAYRLVEGTVEKKRGCK